jgi:uncharacterized membrane-anchored protein YhcB (DUF1043 family)
MHYYDVDKEICLRKVNNSNSFIVFRLPQQHIAEGNNSLILNSECDVQFPKVDIEIANSFISSHSFLALRVLKDEISFIKEGMLQLEDPSSLTLVTFDNSAETNQQECKVLIQTQDLDFSNTYPLKLDNLKDHLINRSSKRTLPVTFFEAPHKLFLSPITDCKRSLLFSSAHSNGNLLKVDNGRTLHSLWTARITYPDSSPPDFRIVGYSTKDEGCRLLPSGENRKVLAELSNERDPHRETRSEFFSVSSLGASANLEYKNLITTEQLDIVKWRQEFELGRDNYAEITKKALDLKTGLKLLVSEIAERKIAKGRSFLHFVKKFEYLEKEKNYPDDMFRNFPFTKIIAEGKSEYFGSSSIRDFIVLPIKLCNASSGPTAENIIRMPYTLVDKAGNKFNKSLEMYIVLENDFNDVAKRKKILDDYDEFVSKNEQNYKLAISFDKEKITLAKPPTETKQNGTSEENSKTVVSEDNGSFKTEQLQFYTICPVRSTFDSEIPVFPRLKYALCYLPQLEGIEKIPAPVYVNYSKDYVLNGIENVENKVFLRILDPLMAVREISESVDLTLDNVQNELTDKYEKAKGAAGNIFSKNYDKIGGLVNPDLIIENVSFLRNSLLFTDKITNIIEKVNPLEFLRGVNTEILGGIDLKRILQQLLPLDECPILEVLDEIPTMSSLSDIDEILREIKVIGNEISSAKKTVDTKKKEISKLTNELQEHSNDLVTSYSDKYLQLSKKLHTSQLLVNSILKFASNDKGLLIEEKIKWDKGFSILRNVWLKETNEKLKTFFNNNKDRLKKLLLKSQLMSSLDQIIVILEIVNYKIPEIFSDAEEIERERKEVLSLKNEIGLEKSELNKALSRELERPDGRGGVELDIRDNLVESLKGIELNSPSDFAIPFGSIIKTNLLELTSSLDLKLREDEVKEIEDNLKKINERIGTVLEKFKIYERKIGKEFEEEIKPLRERLSKVRKTFKDNFTINADISGIAELFKKYKRDFDSVNSVATKALIDTSEELNNMLLDFLENTTVKIQKELEDFKRDYIDVKTGERVKKIGKFKEGIEKLANADKSLASLEIYENEFKNLRSIIDYSSILTKYGIERSDFVPFEEEVKGWLKSLYSDALKTLNSNLNGLDKNILDDKINLFITSGRELLSEEANKAREKYTNERNNFFNSIDDEFLHTVRTKLERSIQDLKVKESELSNNFSKFKSKIDEAKQKLKLYYEELNSSNANLADIRINIQRLEKNLSFLDGKIEKEYVYKWKTDKINEFDFGMVKLVRNGSTPPLLSVNANTKVKIESQRSLVESVSETSLLNFGINFFRIITVYFSKIHLFLGSDSGNTKFDIKINRVELDGSLSFVKAFENALSTLGKGIGIQLEGDAVVVTYEVLIPPIMGGGFNFVNAKVNIRLIIALRAGVPTRIDFGLNSPQDMFLVSAGIYGGEGHFQIGLEAKRGLYKIRFGMDFGAVTMFDFSIGNGRGKVVTGLELSKTSDNVEIGAKVEVSGCVKVLNGFIDIVIVFFLGLKGNGSYLEGSVVIKIKVKISLFYYFKYDLKATKRIYGTNSNQASPLGAGGKGGSETNKVGERCCDFDDRMLSGLTEEIWNSYLGSYYYKS